MMSVDTYPVDPVNPVPFCSQVIAKKTSREVAKTRRDLEQKKRKLATDIHGSNADSGKL